MRTGTRQTVVSVPGRSQICFHTDGVTEARVAGELFGAERLARTLAELGPQATASALLDQVAEETDARPDDMAACLLNVEGGAAAPTILVEELELDRARRPQAIESSDSSLPVGCGAARSLSSCALRASLPSAPAPSWSSCASSTGRRRSRWDATTSRFSTHPT
jgi:hypothetical protein